MFSDQKTFASRMEFQRGFSLLCFIALSSTVRCRCFCKGTSRDKQDRQPRHLRFLICIKRRKCRQSVKEEDNPATSLDSYYLSFRSREIFCSRSRSRFHVLFFFENIIVSMKFIITSGNLSFIGIVISFRCLFGSSWIAPHYLDFHQNQKISLFSLTVFNRFTADACPHCSDLQVINWTFRWSRCHQNQKTIKVNQLTDDVCQSLASGCVYQDSKQELG